MSEPSAVSSRHGSDIAAQSGVSRRGHRRFRLALAVVAAIVLSGTVGGIALYRHGPATVDIHGTWSLTQVTFHGRTTVTTEELTESTVQAQFGEDGSFVIGHACNSTTGSYRVAFDRLRLSDSASTAAACGYVTATAQRVGDAVAVATTAVTADESATVSRRDDDQLELSVNGYELTYAAVDQRVR